MTPFILTLLLLSSVTAVSDSGMPAEVSSAAEVIARFDSRAKVRLLNVWATWCAPCVAEMPVLEHLHAELREQGLDIVGVSMDDTIAGDRNETKEKVARFLRSKKISFENVYYVGKVNEFADELAFEGQIPVTILYDEQGSELMRIEGQIDAADLESRIRAFLTTKK